MPKIWGFLPDDLDCFQENAIHSASAEGILWGKFTGNSHFFGQRAQILLLGRHRSN